MAILLIVFIAISGKWIVGKYEQLTSQSRSDQLCYEEKLEAIIAENQKTQITLAVALEKNAAASDSTNEVLEKCANALRDWESTNKRRQ